MLFVESKQKVSSFSWNTFHQSILHGRRDFNTKKGNQSPCSRDSCSHETLTTLKPSADVIYIYIYKPLIYSNFPRNFSSTVES